MTKEFGQYLNSLLNLGVTEDEFMEVIKLFPKLEKYYLNLDIECCADDIAKELLQRCFINKYQFTYVEDVDLIRKTFSLYDVNSIEELEEIVKDVKEYGWTIDNYDEILSDFKFYEESSRRSDLINYISHNAKLSELEKIVEEYDYEK